MAKIYAVGVGPGDPELITRKAERIIREARVICSPTVSADSASYALSIVSELIDPSRQEILSQVFPMMKKGEELDAAWQEAAAQVTGRVDKGLDVVFITIGDPMLYSTFLYIHRIIRDSRPDIPIEIVPGITSINAAAAAAVLPLGMAGERIAILPATYEDYELRKTLKEFDTVVLMKVSRVFDRVYALLQELGLTDSGVFIRRVGSSREEVISDLESLLGKQLDYLSMLIIRKQ